MVSAFEEGKGVRGKRTNQKQIFVVNLAYSFVCQLVHPEVGEGIW